MNINQVIASFAVALTILFAATSSASAFPIIPAIISFIGLTGVAATIASTVLGIAAAIGLSYLAKALAPKPSMPDISSLPGGTTGKLQFGGAVPRAFGVGRYMTAGSLAYANVYSAATASTAAAALSDTTAASGSTPNAYLVQVVAICDLPGADLVGLFVNGAAATYNPATPAVFEGIPVPEYNKSGKDHLWVKFYDGTQVAADPALVELFGTDPDRPYASTRVGTGVCYAVVTALVNQDLFPGFPQFKFVLDGIALYDRRYDTTAGGSGSQRWATPSTWALTSNPIVIAENILRGISYDGNWVYGAQTVAAAQLPYASWSAAASECDTAIDLDAGGTEPQFIAGGEIRFDVEPAATLEELLKACNGRLAEVGGTYKVRAGAPGSAVFSITDNDILSTEPQTFEPFPGLGQTINAVTAKYISPAEGWVAKDAPPLYDATLETADGGRRQAVDISYGFVTSGTQVQRLMKAERDTHRAMRTHALPLPPEAFVLEPLDVISWTSTRNGYSSKLFEIGSAEDLPNLNMGVAVKEIDPNAYDWDETVDEQPVTDGTLVPIGPPAAQPIVDWNAVPWVITSDGVQSGPGIKLSWDTASDDIDGIAIEIRRASDEEVIYSKSFKDADLFARGSIVVSQNLIYNTAYQARGRYLPISVRDTSWSSWINVTTPDVRATVAALNDELNKRITSQLDEAMALLRDTQGQIASLAAEQDAANWLDKRGTKTALTAAFASAYSAVISESAVRASEDDALAVDITSTLARVDDVSAGSLFRAVASAGTQGALSVIDLQVSASVGATFASAGIQIAAYVDEAEAPYSRLRFYATSTEFGIPGVTGGDFFAPFAVDYVNGVQQIALRSDAIPDGAVTLRTLGSGILGKLSYATSSDVQKTDTQWNNSGNGDIIISTTLNNVSAGSSLLIDFRSLTTYWTSPGATSGWLKLKVNGSVVLTSPSWPLFSRSGSDVNLFSIGAPAALRHLVNDLPGGATTVEVIGYFSSTSGQSIVAKAPSLLMQELVSPDVVDVSTAVTPSVDYRTSLVGGSDGTSGTFSAVDIGTADPYRVVVVAVGMRNPSSVPTLTVGGTSASRVAWVGDWFGQGTYMALFSVRYTTGTTADIVVTIPGSPQDINIHVWKVVAASAAPSRAGGGYTYDADWYSFGMSDITNAVAGEVVIGAAYGADGAATFSETWSGSDSVTERADAATGTSVNRRYAAFDLVRTQAGDKSYTVTQSNAAYAICGVTGRWK